MLRSLIKPKIFRSLSRRVSEEGSWISVKMRQFSIKQFSHEKIIPDSEFNFALQQACKNNKADTVRFLINDPRFNLNAYGKHVIEWALIYDHIDIVKIINQRDIANCKQTGLPLIFLIILIIIILSDDDDDD